MNEYIKPPRLSSSFSRSGKKAKKRFSNILDQKVKRKGYAPIAAAAVCSVMLGGCFAAASVPD